MVIYHVSLRGWCSGFVCACACVRKCTCVQTLRVILKVPLHIGCFSLFLLRQDRSLAQASLLRLNWLASTPSGHSVCTSYHWDFNHMPPCPTFYVSAGDQIHLLTGSTFLLNYPANTPSFHHTEQKVYDWSLWEPHILSNFCILQWASNNVDQL